jgi:drug/metabolite transporter (DMT)-like permease
MKIKSPELSEWLLGAAIVVALVLLINPSNVLMPSAFTLTLIMILAVTMIAFAVFVWREQPRDEREALHGLKAGHISYFIGAGVLVTAIIVQVVQHELYQWLAVALGAMVITKLLVSAWIRRK